MIRALAILAALCAPDRAQDTAAWSGTGCTLVPVTGHEHVAEARCENVLNSTSCRSRSAMRAAATSARMYSTPLLSDPGKVI